MDWPGKPFRHAVCERQCRVTVKIVPSGEESHGAEEPDVEDKKGERHGEYHVAWERPEQNQVLISLVLRIVVDLDLSPGPALPN